MILIERVFSNRPGLDPPLEFYNLIFFEGFKKWLVGFGDRYSMNWFKAVLNKDGIWGRLADST